MTASEKAKYLFDKMGGFRISYAHRIKCAKVVVDEIIVNVDATTLYHKENLVIPFNKEYWQEVKLELDKLAVKK